MSMYHRTYTRIPLTLEVDIQFKGGKLKRAYTRNINPFGAFIKLPKATLAINDFIKIYFTDKDNGDACVEQKGLVMHSSDDGVGILFASDSKDFRTMLGHELTHAYTTVAL
nr:PilZ domain-containing protein [uncultured Glaciecola sp.]